MKPRFMVAKYAQDLRRMEPRNIGIIAWSAGAVAARFAGEKDSTIHAPRELKFSPKDSYSQWIGWWRSHLDAGEIEASRGRVVKVNDPGFLDALAESSRGNFMLVDGGEILDEVKPARLTELADYLFSELVTIKEDEPAVSHESERLKIGTTHVLKRAGISDRRDLQRNWPAPCRIHGVLKVYDFDFAVGDVGKPSLLMHKVLLSHDKTFDSFVLNLDGFYQERKAFPKDQVCTFVYPGEFGDPKTVRSNLSILKTMTNVVDVSNEQEAEDAIREIAARAA